MDGKDGQVLASIDLTKDAKLRWHAGKNTENCPAREAERALYRIVGQQICSWSALYLEQSYKSNFQN